MKQQLSSNWKFHIPDLKVGTLDQLVGLSDDLGKFSSLLQISIYSFSAAGRAAGAQYQRNPDS
jgi:hypothetical protein